MTFSNTYSDEFFVVCHCCLHLQAAEDEEVEKYYNNLEKKEILENKMASTMEIPCKAVMCLQVRRFYFSSTVA